MWDRKNIAEVYFYQEGPGVRKYQFKTSGVKLLNGGNINNGKIDLTTTDIYISEEEAFNKYSHFMIDSGDLLIACSGIVVSNFHNKIAFISDDQLPLCLNTSTMRFKSLDKSHASINYFKYFLQTNDFKLQLGKLITGSAQLNFGPSHIRQMTIPLPPLHIQEKIAEILDKADELRRKDQELQDKYDQLAQSIFIDMFGDPVKNEKGWEVKPFNHFVKFDTNMTSDFKRYGDYPHIGVGNIEKDSGRLVNYNLVKDENIKSGKYIFSKNHIIYSKIRPNLNKVALPDFEGLCSADSYPLLPTINSNRIYFTYLLRSEHFLDFISSFSNRANIPKVNKEQLSKYHGICPPIHLQEEFAKKIEIINQLKAQTNAEKSEELFQSLLQKAFKGELVS